MMRHVKDRAHVRAREAADVSAPPYQLKAGLSTTPGHPARTREVEPPAGREAAVAKVLPQVRSDMGSSSAAPGGIMAGAGQVRGMSRRGPASW